MINVFEVMSQEQKKPPEYPDEIIASYLRYVSLVRNLRSMDNTSSEYIKGNKLDEAQKWLIRHSESIADIAVMNFDRLKEYVDSERNSCDALFYWCDGTKLSYLIEFKKTNKRKLLFHMMEKGTRTERLNKTISIVQITNHKRLLSLRMKLEILAFHP